MTTNKATSPTQKAKQRLLRNKPAVFGMIVIALAIFVAIFGYLLAPDNTPDANNQLIEVPLKSLGFKTKILAVHKNTEVESVSFFKKLFFGKPNPYKLIPIDSYQFLGDSIFVGKYADTEAGEQTQYVGFHLVDVVSPLSIDKNDITKNEEDFTFTM